MLDPLAIFFGLYLLLLGGIAVEIFMDDMASVRRQRQREKDRDRQEEGEILTKKYWQLCVRALGHHYKGRLPDHSWFMVSFGTKKIKK